MLRNGYTRQELAKTVENLQTDPNTTVKQALEMFRYSEVREGWATLFSQSNPDSIKQKSDVLYAIATGNTPHDVSIASKVSEDEVVSIINWYFDFFKRSRLLHSVIYNDSKTEDLVELRVGKLEETVAEISRVLKTLLAT